jgi:hypothetical protein
VDEVDEERAAQGSIEVSGHRDQDERVHPVPEVSS